MTGAAFSVPVAAVRPTRGSVRAAEALGLQRPTAEPDVTQLEVVAVPTGGRRDRWVVGALAVALTLLLLKPWGSVPPSGPVSEPASFVVPTRVDPAGTRIALSGEAFAPSIDGCLDDAAWRVCVLGSSGTQTVRSVFAPDRVAPLESADATTRSAPSVVVMTASGAGLAFYAPLVGPEAAGGSIVVSAWHVDGAERTGTIDLRPLGWLRHGGRVAANAQLTADEELITAPTWPAGRYVIRLQAANGADWDQFFSLVVSEPAGSDGVTSGTIRR